MRKLFCILAMVLILAGTAVAADFAQYSGVLTSDSSVTTKPGYLYGVIVSGAAASAVTLQLFDHASAASGNEIIPRIITNIASDIYRSVTFPYPIKFFNGIYADVTITGTGYYEIYYRND